MANETQVGVIEFAPYTLDLQTGELTRSGYKVRLPGQSFQILVMLLEQAGQVVTREALRQRLWAGDTYVDFEQGLNNAIKRLREAIGDSAERPAYVETVRGMGYRFIGSITPPTAVLETKKLTSAEELPSEGLVLPKRKQLLLFFLGLAAVLLLGAVVVGRRLLPASNRNLRSIVVLPFANLSGDPSQDYLADAMTEEMTGNLAKISALRVISRTSAMKYKHTTKTTPEIALELNVDGVIEGSVIRSGEHLRITAQLIHARSDRHIWSESYERDSKDLLTLQSELARTIAAQVRVVVTPAEEKDLNPEAVNPAAYEAYMRGRFYLDRWTAEDSALALAFFHRAAELDHNYALTYVGMTECYVYGVAGVNEQDGVKRGLAAVTRALELKPEMGEAHAMLGMLNLEANRDFASAEAEIERGIERSPNYAPAHHWYSHLLMDQGRYDEAYVETKKLMDLDPVSPTPIGHLAAYYVATRQADAAIAQFQRLFAMDPELVGEHSELGEAYLLKGRYQEAIAEMRRSVELTRSKAQYPLYLTKLGYAEAQAGNVAHANKILLEIPRKDPQYAAQIYAGLGDRDKSIGLLAEAIRQHTFPRDAGWAVEFDHLRADPRFSELLHRAGLR
jgi:TolB-like protein/DNA-binding winged helix-turn-helix (wHTH) protein/tetratricopeptide (TPR) repeat protein